MSKYVRDDKEEESVESPPTLGIKKVTFKQNRSFELKIGRSMYFFEPYGTLEIPEDELRHRDFIQQSSYFNIK
jgi:hypothetical protein